MQPTVPSAPKCPARNGRYAAGLPLGQLQGIKPGGVTAEGLEAIFPISIGVRSDEGIVSEDIDDLIERMCQPLQEKVGDEENDRGNRTARHQARIAQDRDLLRPDGANWNLLRAIIWDLRKSAHFLPLQAGWQADGSRGRSIRKGEHSGPSI